jgi:hypothetical protein
MSLIHTLTQLSHHTRYPVALNQTLDVYVALNNHRTCQASDVSKDGCSGLREWLPPIKRIVLAGESAGGNLAAGLTVRILQLQDEINEETPLEASGKGPSSYQIFLPDGLVLIYPALNFSMAPSPSRAVLNFDPVMPLGIM